MTMTSELIWGFAFFAGALAQLLARLSGWPSVVLLLAAGVWCRIRRIGDPVSQ